MPASASSFTSITAAKIFKSFRKDWLNHVAGFFRALALLQTDVLLLQGFMLVSSKFTIFRLARSKDWTQTAYVTLFASLSFFGMARLLADRFVQLDDAETSIWKQHCDLLTLSEMSYLLSCARGRTVPINEEPRLVLASGSKPKLLLLLDGKMEIHTTGSAATEHPLVVIERGPGFTGEVSFVSSLVDANGGETTVRADVIFSPGSHYLEFEMGELEAMMRKQPSLRNAIIALLSRSLSNKLYATTKSLGRANKKMMVVHTKLIESQYKSELLDLMLDTLATTVDATGEQAALAPDGLRVLQPKLEHLQHSRGISTDLQHRILMETGLDLEQAKWEQQSLVDLCKTKIGHDSARHTQQSEEVGRLVTRKTLVAKQTEHTGSCSNSLTAGYKLAPLIDKLRLRGDSALPEEYIGIRSNENMAILGTLAM
eukprot:CAMPEP_0115842786 /NCGR_PEP_ID=MMETSP0287-20121206/7977_1 /TAXON_ID=412157 /ORGANISM="Chrysochromulina rotalis, Strain UIO044" /LENGTH=427 /DNA_ID=CAMNT_0003296461 /DNA_START=136 /DNA_END=1419 /DNA_ORIENTATION=-